MIDFKDIPSPAFVLDESLLRKNLSLIKSVKERSGAEIILAFKAFALWKAFPIIREYVSYAAASSVFEAQLAFEEMGNPAYTYSPAYTEKNFPTILKYSSHITFNSLNQFERFYPAVRHFSDRKISCGLRINPEYSSVKTALYNPCSPGSRMGILSDLLGDKLPEGVEGLHCHTLCESTSFELEKTLVEIEKRFGRFLPEIKWLNMGGGHLMTRKDYDAEHLIQVLKDFQSKYPHIQLILEPGSAFGWETGYLVSSVVDIVENRGIKTAILDVSFACHMPDCLEMPYKPGILGATDAVKGKPTYRMGGNSCLAGDFMGDWSFEKPLKIGDQIVFEDMIHYTIVKTTMFNGIPHPALVFQTLEGKNLIWRSFDYSDYKNRMD
ncbi:MAG: carboxynorspermidine decarboxylase [Bacteroidales bacterium]|nr:carboxynorspermidine decarboxylase [Bacteroidales bacterium]